MIFDQTEFGVRCEWGEKGIAALAPVSDVVIVVDVLSFSTAVDIAVGRGAAVFPYRWKDETADRYALSIGAEVAGEAHDRGYSLSPMSLLEIPASARLVLPSPNGSALCTMTGEVPTITACLRNCRAAAEAAMRLGSNIAIVPAGEKWEDGSLRPCFEDLVGAGAVIKHLRGDLSPEAAVALSTFEVAAANLEELMKACSSAKEKLSRGQHDDVSLASALDISDCVPILRSGSFERY